MRLVRETVLAEDVGNRAESRGLDEVGAGLEEAAMHGADDVGPGEDDMLVAALVLRAAEILGPEVEALDVSAERAVDHEDTIREQLLEEVYSGSVCHQCLGNPLGRT